MLVKLPPHVVRCVARLKLIMSLEPLKDDLHVGRSGVIVREMDALVEISGFARLVGVTGKKRKEGE